MPLTPERLERLTQRKARLQQHIDDPTSTPLPDRRVEWQQELAKIDAELAGNAPSPSQTGTVVDVPLGTLTAKTDP